MPKQTFYNLEKEKQNKIIEAAVLEMEQYPLDELSINRVIKTADISRGSFYQYFEDKDDLVSYVLREFTGIIKENVERITGEKGITLEAAKDALNLIVSLVSNDRIKAIMRNLFSSIKLCDNRVIGILADGDNIISSFTSVVDVDKLRFKSEKEIFLLVEMGLSMFRDTAVRCMMDIDNADKYIEDFEIKVRMLEEGVKESK